MKISRVGLAVLITSAALVGCNAPPPFLPNSNPALRKTSAQFAADAAHHHYESTAPKAGQANGRVEVDYGIGRLTIANLSTEDWNDVEIWVNQKYVVSLPKITGNMQGVVQINFQSIFDDSGNHLPISATEKPVNTVEMFKDGKMYSLGVPHLAD